MNKITYHVAPRYTAGSPAMVDERTYKHVHKAEREAYHDILDYGKDHDDWQKSQDLGLAWIAFTSSEFRGHIIRVCELTGKMTRQPINPEKEGPPVPALERRRALKNAKDLRMAVAILRMLDEKDLAVKVEQVAKDLRAGAV